MENNCNLVRYFFTIELHSNGNISMEQIYRIPSNSFMRIASLICFLIAMRLIQFSASARRWPRAWRANVRHPHRTTSQRRLVGVLEYAVSMRSAWLERGSRPKSRCEAPLVRDGAARGEPRVWHCGGDDGAPAAA